MIRFLSFEKTNQSDPALLNYADTKGRAVLAMGLKTTVSDLVNYNRLHIAGMCDDGQLMTRVPNLLREFDLGLPDEFGEANRLRRSLHSIRAQAVTTAECHRARTEAGWRSSRDVMREAMFRLGVMGKHRNRLGRAAQVWLNWFKTRDLLGVNFQRFSMVSNWKPLETQTSSLCELDRKINF